jgi:hypothetical protein
VVNPAILHNANTTSSANHFGFWGHRVTSVKDTSPVGYAALGWTWTNALATHNWDKLYFDLIP